MLPFAGTVLLLDIEGTTSSVSYVFEVLFPYARRHVEPFLAANWDEPDVRAACEQIARDAGAPSLADWTGGVAGEEARRKVVAEVYRLMDGDVKATGLKELQGLIWRDGFLTGRLRSHVYDDVPPALRAWRDAGLDVRIYSSGSVTAQKLFFAHTGHGDLLPLLNGHYDTTTGPKKEADSYRKIARDAGRSPGDILFCSDVAAELDAAAAAEMRTALVVRPGNAPTPAGHGHPVITSFEDISRG